MGVDLNFLKVLHAAQNGEEGVDIALGHGPRYDVANNKRAELGEALQCREKSL